MTSTDAILPPGSARHINIDEDWEREYWAKHFHITQAELFRIVSSVGPDANAVGRFLLNQTRSRAQPVIPVGPPRKVVSKASIAGLIRAQMSLLPECARCTCGAIKWRAADFDGCNWSITRFDGSNSLYCLERLGPLISNLRETMNIPDPERHLRTSQVRAFLKIRAVPQAGDAAFLAAADLVDAGREAARKSRVLLSAIKAGRRLYRARVSGSMAAVDASRQMLDRLAKRSQVGEMNV